MSDSMLRGIGYLLSITLVLYALSSLSKGQGFFATSVGRLFGLLVAILLAYFISRIFYGLPLDWGADGKSLSHAVALMFPLYAFSFVAVLYFGAERFMDMARPGFVDEWSLSLIPYSLAFWILSGILTAFSYDAVPYELFGERGRTAGIAGATVVFALNYNQPLLTGFWRPEDIVFFGAAFAYSYSVNGKASSLVIAYLISELPLWWCLLYPLGGTVFVGYMTARFLLSACFLFRHLA
ncbi:hypothetical protein FH039_09580 [Thermococcus indicus]|uniref:CPBP family intramembrane metalloprotease n=1 Tax=Thermococcus indicus TaxID=2586643 RepID=A0A4Y5SLN8_9EURY|nr:hypothetical protein [Thermococcus indicus]QDA31798.1 hypothetical protein FH039_09580 [Thermococcus indicus]